MLKTIKPMVVALIGNPNSGKTTVFNGLTGKRQHVGNWAGVTVEKKQGHYDEVCDEKSLQIHVIDLPGCYSIELRPSAAADEEITQTYLLSKEADLYINVIDATHLERHLYLTLELIERGLPIMVALNMMDAAHQQKIEINIDRLQKHLGCPVVPLSALKNQGILELKKCILQEHIKKMSKKAQAPSLNIEHPTLFNPDALMQDTFTHAAKTRFKTIRQLMSETVVRHPKPPISWTEKIDRIVLHRLLGIPIFLALMYLVFILTIHVSGLFQDFFDIGSRTLFVEAPKQWLIYLDIPAWIVGIIAFGVGQGVNITVSFIPVIASMFFCLSFLEASGYMARAAFIMDKVMQWVGLPGKSFVPMIIGFGCNVPAVMATRTLENHRDRVLTILMSPFMSCGARLAIFALFVSAFFPANGHNIIFGLYWIGILIALLTGFALRSTVLQGKSSALVIELPPYRWPQIKTLGRTTWHRLKRFIIKAGVLIIPLCMLIGTLGSLNNQTKMSHWFEKMARQITPIFSPMGIQADNWPATIGLLTGIMAKEVVVGTLTALYTQEAQEKIQISSSLPTTTVEPSIQSFSIRAGLKEAFFSIWENILQLKDAIYHPVLNTLQETPQGGILGVMVERFGSFASAFAYLLFVLLYFPCISVVAVIARELNKSWAVFSVVWTTGIAYIVAVLFYQSAIFLENPIHSLAWILSLITVLIVGLWGMRRFVHSKMSNNRTRKPLPDPILILDA